MKRIARILASLLLAALLWGGSVDIASAHPGHHGDERWPVAADATAQAPNLVFAMAETPSGQPEPPISADHCVQYQCQAAPGLSVAAEASLPAFAPRDIVLPASGAVPNGAFPDPPKRPPRIPS